jgi:hypothetical protein
VSGAVPVALTDKVALCPLVMDTFAGSAVIDGATATVIVAVLLLTEPAEFVTFTQ